MLTEGIILSIIRSIDIRRVLTAIELKFVGELWDGMRMKSIDYYKIINLNGGQRVSYNFYTLGHTWGDIGVRITRDWNVWSVISGERCRSD